MNNDKITLSGAKKLERTVTVCCSSAPKPPGAGPRELLSFASWCSVGPYSRGHWRDAASCSREAASLPLPVLGCLLWRPSGPFHHHPKWTASSCQSLACRLRPSSGLLQHSLNLAVIEQAAALSSPRTSEPQLRFGGGVCSKWVGGYSPKHRGSDVTYFCYSVELSFASLNSSPPFISS